MTCKSRGRSCKKTTRQRKAMNHKKTNPKKKCGPCSRHPPRSRRYEIPGILHGPPSIEKYYEVKAPPPSLLSELSINPYEPRTPPSSPQTWPSIPQQYEFIQSAPPPSPRQSPISLRPRPPVPIRPPRPPPKKVRPPKFVPKLSPILELSESSPIMDVEMTDAGPLLPTIIPLESTGIRLRLRFHSPPPLLVKQRQKERKEQKQQTELPPLEQPVWLQGLFGQEQKHPPPPLPPSIHNEEPKPILIPIKTVDRRSCELKFHNYKRQKKLGKGSYGSVFELCNGVGCPYVLKVMELWDPREMSAFVREVQTQIYVYEKFGFTPAVYDTWYCETKPRKLTAYIVMERMDLISYLRRNARTLSNEFIRTLIQTMRLYISKVHKVGITHNDIADRNIFFKRVQRGGERVEWVLGDWGFARNDGKGVKDQRDIKALEQQLWSIKHYLK